MYNLKNSKSFHVCKQWEELHFFFLHRNCHSLSHIIKFSIHFFTSRHVDPSPSTAHKNTIRATFPIIIFANDSACSQLSSKNKYKIYSIPMSWAIHGVRNRGVNRGLFIYNYWEEGHRHAIHIRNNKYNIPLAPNIK